MSANDLHANVLLPNFLSQMNAFVVDCQMIMAPEALATFFTLVGLLTCNKHELMKGLQYLSKQQGTKQNRS